MIETPTRNQVEEWLEAQTSTSLRTDERVYILCAAYLALLDRVERLERENKDLKNAIGIAISMEPK